MPQATSSRLFLRASLHETSTQQVTFTDASVQAQLHSHPSLIKLKCLGAGARSRYQRGM